MKMLNTNTGISTGRQSGFTLIEIAIVLVIIGLLLGGVLKGQELITTARVHALNNTVDGITAAWFSFQDRYRAFPGDYSSAQASINLPGVTNGGDGNGLVDTTSETALAWVHLAAAGYLTGGYKDAGNTIALNEYGCNPTLCPENGFGSGMVITYNNLQQNAPVSANELISGHGIPVQVLAELDRKVDDGLANSGAMQLGKAGANWIAAQETACKAADGIHYDLQTPSSDCAAVFRNF
jgi:prepilin-type N-terminal cleavage/methylation domain-containing protein